MAEWVRIEDDEHPRWVLIGQLGETSRLCTDEAIRQFGRRHMEGLLAGLPPLPERAWLVQSLDQRIDYLRQTGALLCSKGQALTEADVAAVEQFSAQLRNMPPPRGRHHAETSRP